jgi:hypothetical protein
MVVAPLGRAVCEVKSGNATRTKEQRSFHGALSASGVPVHVARSVDEAREALAEGAELRQPGQ